MEKVYLNGNIVERDEARVSVFDRGFMYGDGVFETLRSYNGRPFRSPFHWRRLFRGLGMLGIPAPLSIDEMDAAVSSIIEANAVTDGVVRVEITRGPSSRGPGTPAETKPTVVITCSAYSPVPESVYEQGVGIAISRVRRVPDICIPSEIKSANYLNCILARRDAESAGDYEAVMLDLRGNLSECAASNIFLVSNDMLITPPLSNDVLPGVTRELVMELAGARDVAVKEKACTTSDLRCADEVFLTNSVIEVMPVRTVEGAPVGAECPGRITRKIRDAYKARIVEECGL
ncbi:MAG: aminotransferase class IV [Candidatus Hydrogenedentes bacterium]|nr:aminotransferase class IV [Candidatus Hydrogenedentota bacterium]